MSIVGHFSVFDKKACEYAPVFTAKNADVAKRMLVQSLSADSVLCRYPGDYALVHLCDFDTDEGEILLTSVDEVANLVDLIPDELKQFALDGSLNDPQF